MYMYCTVDRRLGEVYMMQYENTCVRLWSLIKYVQNCDTRIIFIAPSSISKSSQTFTSVCSILYKEYVYVPYVLIVYTILRIFDESHKLQEVYCKSITIILKTHALLVLKYKYYFIFSFAVLFGLEEEHLKIFFKILGFSLKRERNFEIMS